MTIDPEGPTPPYVQLAAILRERIASGELAPGRRVPPESTLEQEYELSRGTVRRAIKMLRDEGLVYTVPQRGTYVSDDKPDHP